jgi:predicted transcriptional regulator
MYMKSNIDNQSSNISDWFDELSLEQQDDILIGLLEADNGETIPHSEAVTKFQKYGLK